MLEAAEGAPTNLLLDRLTSTFFYNSCLIAVWTFPEGQGRRLRFACKLVPARVSCRKWSPCQQQGWRRKG